MIPTRPVRPALVIRCGRPTRPTSTVPIAYDRDDAAAEWYAELRAKQAAGR